MSLTNNRRSSVHITGFVWKLVLKPTTIGKVAAFNYHFWSASDARHSVTYSVPRLFVNNT